MNGSATFDRASVESDGSRKPSRSLRRKRMPGITATTPITSAMERERVSAGIPSQRALPHTCTAPPHGDAIDRRWERIVRRASGSRGMQAAAAHSRCGATNARTRASHLMTSPGFDGDPRSCTPRRQGHLPLVLDRLLNRSNFGSLFIAPQYPLIRHFPMRIQGVGENRFDF